jgi:hypothetical protein
MKNEMPTIPLNGVSSNRKFVGNTQELKTGLKTHQNLSGFAEFTQVGRAKK